MVGHHNRFNSCHFYHWPLVRANIYFVVVFVKQAIGSTVIKNHQHDNKWHLAWHLLDILFCFQLLESSAYGKRKGAAYGLAGLVKGLGILHLKQLNIMSTLQEAIQDKKKQQHREGALFAYEMLCSMLGRLFEPYVVHVLPNLLLCFGDGSSYVRQVKKNHFYFLLDSYFGHLKACYCFYWGSCDILGNVM